MKKNLITSLFVMLVSLMMVSGTALAQDWDGGDATNNDDGGSDSDTTSGTQSDSSSSNGWDGGDATNDDDGTSTQGDRSSDSDWDGGDADNDGDGSSTSGTWDGNDATNDNDGGETSSDDGTNTGNDDTGSDDSNTDTTSDSDTADTSSNRGGSGGGEINRADIEVMQPEITVDMPNTVAVGETVEIEGHVDYPRVREIDILVDGRIVQETTLDDAYNFNAQFTVNEAGEHTVEVRTREASIERELYVTTAVDVSNIDAPSTVDSGRNVDICADVSSVANPQVSLRVDGVEVATQSGTGRVCFETDLSQGTHTVSIEADVAGDRDTETTIITVTGEGSDSTSGDLSDSPRTSAGIFQSMVNMLASIVAFIVNLVPIL